MSEYTSSDFDERLRQEVASYSSENAPAGLRTCPNCCNRIKLDSKFGDNAWECTAISVLPIFAVSGEPYRFPIMLNLFDPKAPQSDLLNKTSCPLFSSDKK